MPKAPSRLTAAVAASVASLLLLGACGSKDGEESGNGGSSAASGSGTPTLADPDPEDEDKVEGIDVIPAEDEKAPSVELPDTPLSVTQTTRHILEEGSGEELSEDAMAEVDLAMFSAKDGTAIQGTETYTTSPAYFSLSQSQQLQGVAKAIRGQRVGSHGVAVLPPEDVFGEDGMPQYGINGEDDVVVVFDVRGEMPKEAEGTEVPPKEGLPEVEWHSDEAADISVPEGEDPPKDLVEQKLIKGDGTTVQEGDTAYVTYSVAKWEDGEVFDSSMEDGRPPFGFSVGQGTVVSGFDEAVEGAKVGDRLLLVLPPEDGYGKEGSPDGTVRATDTLIYVVDVLAAP